MAKFDVKVYKGFKIGHWIGDKNYFIFPETDEKPIIDQNVLAMKKSLASCEKYVDNLTK